jgi:hypothetical protein
MTTLDQQRAPCACGWLERSAAESENAIVFDAPKKEFNLSRSLGRIAKRTRRATSRVLEDPFLAVVWWHGAGVERDSFFAMMTREESERLTKAYGNLPTVTRPSRIWAQRMPTPERSPPVDTVDGHRTGTRSDLPLVAISESVAKREGRVCRLRSGARSRECRWRRSTSAAARDDFEIAVASARSPARGWRVCLAS